MGYMVHHAILVTTFDEQRAKIAHKKAIEIFDNLVSEVVTQMRESVVNGYHSFTVFPDGSKDGWTDSDTGDQHRAAFIEWLESQRYEDRSSPYDWVEVQYGDDNGDTKIINDSEAWKRKE